MLRLSGILTMSSGEQRDGAEFYRNDPVIVIFLRHLGCIFCREQVQDLNAHPDWNILFICQAQPDEAGEFKNAMNSPHHFACDPEAKLYEEFGLERGGLRELFSAPVVKRGFQAWGKGVRQGRTIGDPWRMPGEFIFNTEGNLVWENRARHAADHSPAEILGAALKRASASSTQEP